MTIILSPVLFITQQQHVLCYALMSGSDKGYVCTENEDVRQSIQKLASCFVTSQ